MGVATVPLWTMQERITALNWIWGVGFYEGERWKGIECMVLLNMETAVVVLLGVVLRELKEVLLRPPSKSLSALEHGHHFSPCLRPAIGL